MPEMTIRDLIRKAAIPRVLAPTFDKLRLEAFEITKKVYEDRAASYDQDRPCYECYAYGPLSLVSIVYDKAWRLAQLASPTREEPLRDADINRILDSCIDTMNYLSWLYALVTLASGFENRADSSDTPNYIGVASPEIPETNGKIDPWRNNDAVS